MKWRSPRLNSLSGGFGCCATVAPFSLSSSRCWRIVVMCTGDHPFQILERINPWTCRPLEACTYSMASLSYLCDWHQWLHRKWFSLVCTSTSQYCSCIAAIEGAALAVLRHNLRHTFGVWVVLECVWDCVWDYVWDAPSAQSPFFYGLVSSTTAAKIHGSGRRSTTRNCLNLAGPIKPKRLDQGLAKLLIVIILEKEGTTTTGW